MNSLLETENSKTGLYKAFLKKIVCVFNQKHDKIYG